MPLPHAAISDHPRDAISRNPTGPEPPRVRYDDVPCWPAYQGGLGPPDGFHHLVEKRLDRNVARRVVNVARAVIHPFDTGLVPDRYSLGLALLISWGIEDRVVNERASHLILVPFVLFSKLGSLCFDVARPLQHHRIVARPAW